MKVLRTAIAGAAFALLRPASARPAPAAQSIPKPALQPSALPTAAPAAAETEEATLRLGAMAERLGHQVSAALLTRLGFPPAKKIGAHPVYLESDWPRICSAIAQNALDARVRKEF